MVLQGAVKQATISLVRGKKLQKHNKGVLLGRIKEEALTKVAAEEI